MSVYFAQVGRYIKVGYSENPERRVRNLFKSETRYSAPADAPVGQADRHLIRAIDGDLQVETAAHRALDDFRLHGEWFVDEPEVRAFIATAEPATHYAPVARPAGPVFNGYDETRDLAPAELAQLREALNSMFRPGLAAAS